MDSTVMAGKELPSRMEGYEPKEAIMKVGKKTPYATWHKVVLVGCLITAVLGTIAVLGAMIKVSGVLSEYGGSIGAPFFVALIIGLLSTWLFAGSGALLVYIAKSNSDIRAILASNAQGV